MAPGGEVGADWWIMVGRGQQIFAITLPVLLSRRGRLATLNLRGFIGRLPWRLADWGFFFCTFFPFVF